MNKIFLVFRMAHSYILLIAFIILFSGALSSALAITDTDRQTHVILISIDGLANYHLDNPELLLPNLQELIENGTRAEASRSIFPTVTHPSHATLITGVSPRHHGVIGNLMTNRETGKSHHPTTQTRKEAIQTQTLFDLVHEAGLTTAAFCWPEIRQDPSVDFKILHGHDELSKDEIDPALLENLRQAGIPIDSYYDRADRSRLERGHRDAILTESAAEIIKTHKPEFLALHFLVTDAVQHGWGPDHYLSQGALTYADYHLGLVRQAVQDAGIQDRTVFVIAADHGFHSVYHEINVHPVLKASGLSDRVRLHGSGWTVFAETTNDFDERRDGKALQSFFQELLKLDGMGQIIKNDEFHELGYPRYEENPHVLGQYMIFPDIDTFLIVDSNSESTKRQLRSQPYHGHGYLPDHPRMHTALIMSGYGIRKGQKIGMVRNQDVAPTIAEILGLTMQNVEGRPLVEAFE